MTKYVFQVFAVSLLVFLAGSVHAAVDPLVRVKGTVIGIDEKIIKISNQGTVTLAPRASAPKSVRVGDMVEVSFNLEEFKKQLPAK